MRKHGLPIATLHLVGAERAGTGVDIQLRGVREAGRPSRERGIHKFTGYTQRDRETGEVNAIRLAAAACSFRKHWLERLELSRRRATPRPGCPNRSPGRLAERKSRCISDEDAGWRTCIAITWRPRVRVAPRRSAGRGGHVRRRRDGLLRVRMVPLAPQRAVRVPERVRDAERRRLLRVRRRRVHRAALDEHAHEEHERHPHEHHGPPVLLQVE